MPRSLLLAACVALALPLSARTIDPPKPTEKWVALEAEEFRLISAASASETRRIARDLLRMRAAFGKVSDLKVHSAERTRVFIFPAHTRFAPYCEAVLRSKCDVFTGLFAAGSSGNFIVLSGDAKGGVDRIVYHELTHHLMANANVQDPLWYREGIAEYFSTFRTSGAEAHFGVVVHDHLRWLRAEASLGSLRKRLMPLRELFAITQSSPAYDERTRTGVLYAQSWALVHYLVHDDSRSEKLHRFLELLRGGKPVDRAFDEAFGMSFSALEQALRTYIRGDSFTYYARDVGELAIPTLPEPAAMPHDAVLHQLGSLLAQTRPENAALAERFFQAAVGANERNAGAHASLAQLYAATGRAAEAEAAYAKAVEIGSDDAEVYLLAGRSILHGDTGGFAKARPLFKRATELHPASAEAWTGLGATYLGQTVDLAAGIAALEKSLELDPQNEEAVFYLAQLWAADGRIAAARKLAQLLLARTSDKTLQGQITNVLSSLDRLESAQALTKARQAMQSADQALAWLSEAVDKANAGKITEALALIDAALPALPTERARNQALLLRDKLTGAAPRRR
ncbi:MAG TPA: tetratricopeptide repeat protein [Thermoanaerobaculia bacterium]